MNGLVPRIVHQVWLGGEPFPLILGALVDSVRYQVTGGAWTYRLWNEQALISAFGNHWTEPAGRCCHLSQRSNLARYLILMELGGLYLDTDVELFGLLDYGWCGAWIAGTSPEPDPCQVNPCCLAAPPCHPYVLRMLDAILRGEVELSRHMAAGPLLAVDKIGPDVNIWPAHVWHGKRGRAGAIGHHFGWGPRLKSFTRFGRMPPTGDVGVVT